MKKIGIIGGLGPLATVKFMELLEEDLKNTEDNIELVVINDPTTPDRTSYILDNNKPNPLNKILEMVKKLEICDVSIITMPCNTASYFYKEIEAKTNIPFINIVSETVKYLKGKNIKSVGVLATEGTIKSGIYEELLKEYQINYLIPTNDEQKIISSIIYDGIKSGKPIDLNNFYQVINSLKEQGAECVVLGCTELSALRQIYNLEDEILVDAMKILADATIKYLSVK